MRGKITRIFKLNNMWKLKVSLSGMPTHRKSSIVDRIENWVAPRTITNVVEEKRVLPRRESKSLRSTHTLSFSELFLITPVNLHQTQ
jgi:hypothetical protein